MQEKEMRCGKCQKGFSILVKKWCSAIIVISGITNSRTGTEHGLCVPQQLIAIYLFIILTTSIILSMIHYCICLS